MSPFHGKCQKAYMNDKEFKEMVKHLPVVLQEHGRKSIKHYVLDIIDEDPLHPCVLTITDKDLVMRQTYLVPEVLKSYTNGEILNKEDLTIYVSKMILKNN